MPKKKNKVIEKTRRANGEGSIYQQKNGRWTGKIWITNPDGTKTRKTVYGENQTDVAKKLVELTGSMNPLNSKIFVQKSFGQLFEDWLMIFKKSAVSPRTFESSVRNWRLHIKPYVNNMKITELSSQAIQQVVNEILLKGKSVNLARKIKFLFNQFFEYAIECGYVENNPTTKIKIRTRDISYENKENSYKAIPQEERLTFINALSKTTLLKPLCMTMMFAGLRTGEALALRWNNIDLDNKIIKVRNGITQVPIFDNYGKVISRKTVIGDTKTACSIRDVPIPDILVDTLKDWRKCQWVKQQMTGIDLLSPNAIVFCNDDGSVRTYSGTRRIFDRFKKRVGLEKSKIHFHTLRHTYSTMLFEMNENPKIIQVLLGHKSVKTTLTVYNSVDKSYIKEATERLNNLFSKEKMQEFNELTNKPNIPALQKTIEIDNKLDEDPEIAFLEKLLAEKKAKKMLNQEEM